MPATFRPRETPGHSLADLLTWLFAEVPDCHLAGAVPADADAMARIHLSGVSLSTKRISPGDLYAALPGSRAHGAQFVAEALARGAVAVLTDVEGARRLQGSGDSQDAPMTVPVPVPVPVFVVPDPRGLLGRLSAFVYGDPSARLAMIGVTGTQGKTTTTRLAESGLTAIGWPSAVIGTVGTRIAGADLDTSLTTPEAPDLHGLFAVMAEAGVKACAMEVSSHALVLGRVDGVCFDVAGFLNLGHDHLDFHADLEDYYAAKARLFVPERCRVAVINIDDEFGRRLARDCEVEVRTLSTRPAREVSSADWRAEDIVLTATGSSFTAVSPTGERCPAGVPIAGDFNVANALMAIALCVEAGAPMAGIAAGIASGAGVPGRLERVDPGEATLDRFLGVTVIVDYAHKPDAVRAALTTLRPLTQGRLITVMGAGGDRDRAKRPVMGRIAAELADVLIVTDDNPRTEDPASIREALAVGAAEVVDDPSLPTRLTSLADIGDRRAAIGSAISQARPGDIVLIAGKGHETGQEIHGVVHPFDDREVVRQILTMREGGGS